jgi:hypothetical protein
VYPAASRSATMTWPERSVMPADDRQHPGQRGRHQLLLRTSVRLDHQPVNGPLCLNNGSFNEVREANSCDLRIEQSEPYCA